MVCIDANVLFLADINNKNANSFEPQTSINYEVGAKYIGDSFALNTAIFRMDIKDVHIYRTDGVMFSTSNADKGHSQGIEFDGTYFITDNLSLSGSLGLIQAKYDDYNGGVNPNNGNTVKYDGNRTFKRCWRIQDRAACSAIKRRKNSSMKAWRSWAINFPVLVNILSFMKRSFKEYSRKPVSSGP